MSEITTAELADYLRIQTIVTSEAVGTGNGSNKAFYLDYHPAFAQEVYVGGAIKTETTDYTFDKETGKITFVTAPANLSAVTVSYSSVLSADNARLTVLLNASKAFMRKYTGISERDIAGEDVGIGDGETVKFTLKYSAIPNTATLYADSAELTADTDYTLNDTTGEIVMAEAPADGVEITADYETGLDAYEDFVIAVYVLVQDMYDNRSMYVDSANINRTVDCILNMHSLNLL